MSYNINYEVVSPPFEGNDDPDGYFGWESEVDLFFSNYPCPAEEQVKIVTREFYHYARDWWNRLRRNRGGIRSWRELKYIMREHYVPYQYNA